ncbi:hypothetical protein [Bacillus sp. CHD6a]|uniref:hypothetical protein n=1 Tax=Bacillus sp. CHD6a TaxID=1643452 RepID=UPI0006CCC345|nr:hypothetical protein [Bacillus sp. CHD6a]KPB05097.1 hypothetical protein AAV98_08415 [Bacillus sp. CHD6a]
MRVLVIGLGVAMLFILSGCTGPTGVDDAEWMTPPEAVVIVDGDTYETVRGSFCWSNKRQGGCEDHSGSVDLLANKEPIIVAPGEEITIDIPDGPEPSEYSVDFSLTDQYENIVVLAVENKFSAPTEEGLYYFSYFARWENKTYDGDAYYAFLIEVDKSARE